MVSLRRFLVLFQSLKARVRAALPAAQSSASPAAGFCARLDPYPLSGMKVGMATPRKGEKAPRTWQKWSSQLRAPQA